MVKSKPENHLKVYPLKIDYGGLTLHHFRKYSAYTAFFLLAGCLNEENVAQEVTKNSLSNVVTPSTCTISTDAFTKLPAEVLYGTEVVDLKTFKKSQIVNHHFQTETGGSIVTLDINFQANNPSIKRSYKEPDIAEDIANYKNVCIDGEYIFGKDVRGIFTEQGILWLELNSKNDFISSDLWIYMDKQ